MIRNTISAILLLFLTLSEILGQNTNPKGVTVITHGFDLTGGGYSFDIDYWIEFGAAIKNRAGGGTVFINNDNGTWEIANFSAPMVARYGENGWGNPDEEMIFIYNWSKISNDKSQQGHIEAAADLLFAQLVTLPKQMNVTNTINLFESTKPIHLIGHSRGTILLLQLCHRIAKYFPNKKIDHYTSLDPHPALSMWDADRNERILSLPGIDGEPINDTNIGSLHLRLPNNILKADNYYRQDGIFEEGVLDVIPDFDGIPNFSINSLFNRKLVNSTLLYGTPSLSHSGVHRWYFETIDTLITPTNPQWFQIGADNLNVVSEVPRFRETRGKTGYNYSRLGGRFSNLPNLTSETMSLSEMENKIKNRYANNIKGMSTVFNGDFLFEEEAGWYQMIPNRQQDDIEIIDFALKIKNNTSIFHNYLYFLSTTKALKFRVNKNHVSSVFYNIVINFYNNTGNLVGQNKVKIIKEQFNDIIYVPIPTILKGKSGTFEMVFTDFSGTCYLDDVNLTDETSEYFNVSLNLRTPFVPCLNENTTYKLSAIASKQGVSYEFFRNNISNGEIISTQKYDPSIPDSVFFYIKNDGDYHVVVTDLITGQSAISNTIKIDSKITFNPTIIGETYKPFGTPFNLSTGQYSTYLWEGLNGFNFQANTRNVSIPNTFSNIYRLRLTVTSSNGCVKTKEFILSSNRCGDYPARVPLTISSNLPDSSYCGTIMRITAHGRILSSYLWRFRDLDGGVSYSRTTENFIDIGWGFNSSVKFISVGAYSADTSIICFVPSNEILIKRYIYLNGTIEKQSLSPFEGDTIKFSANLINLPKDVNWKVKWSGPNNFYSNSEDVLLQNVTLANNGNYKLEVLSDSVCKEQYPANNTVSISVKSGYKVILPREQNTFCQGSVEYFLITASCLSCPLSYDESYFVQYSDPNGLFSNDYVSNIIATSNIAGVYIKLTFNMPVGTNYKLRVIYFNKYSKRIWYGPPSTFSINIVSGANIAITSSNGNLLCPNSSTTLSVKPINGFSINWYKDNQYFSYQNPVNVNQAGTYYAVAFSSNVANCQIRSNKYSISIPANPEPTISANLPIYVADTLHLSANVSLGSSYLWTGPNNFTSISRKAIIKNVTSNNSGTYNVLSQDLCNRSFLRQININVLPRGVCETLNSGSWHNAVNWSCGHIPTLLDDVIIKTGHKINLNDNQSGFCKKLNIEFGAVFDSKSFLFIAKPN